MNKETMDKLIHMYNCGYLAGHDDTVEDIYVHIYQVDMDTDHEDKVMELLEELDRDAFREAFQAAFEYVMDTPFIVFSDEEPEEVGE